MAIFGEIRQGLVVSRPQTEVYYLIHRGQTSAHKTALIRNAQRIFNVRAQRAAAGERESVINYDNGYLSPICYNTLVPK